MIARREAQIVSISIEYLYNMAELYALTYDASMTEPCATEVVKAKPEHDDTVAMCEYKPNIIEAKAHEDELVTIAARFQALEDETATITVKSNVDLDAIAANRKG